MTPDHERVPHAGWDSGESLPSRRQPYWDGSAWTESFREQDHHYIRHPEDSPQPLRVVRNTGSGAALLALGVVLSITRSQEQVIDTAEAAAAPPGQAAT